MWNFGTKFFNGGGGGGGGGGERECETPEKNPDFLGKGRMVKFRSKFGIYFFRSRMTKRTSPLESSREI